MFIFLMFFEDFAGSLGYACRDAGKFCYFNAIAAVGGSCFNRPEKDNPILRFFDGYMVVLDTG